MRNLQLEAVVWKEGKYYVSQCLNFDLASHGSTEAQALDNLKEAVELYLEDKKAHKPRKIFRPNLMKMKVCA